MIFDELMAPEIMHKYYGDPGAINANLALQVIGWIVLVGAMIIPLRVK